MISHFKRNLRSCAQICNMSVGTSGTWSAIANFQTAIKKTTVSRQIVFRVRLAHAVYTDLILIEACISMLIDCYTFSNGFAIFH